MNKIFHCYHRSFIVLIRQIPLFQPGMPTSSPAPSAGMAAQRPVAQTPPTPTVSRPAAPHAAPPNTAVPQVAQPQAGNYWN